MENLREVRIRNRSSLSQYLGLGLLSALLSLLEDDNNLEFNCCRGLHLDKNIPSNGKLAAYLL